MTLPSLRFFAETKKVRIMLTLIQKIAQHLLGTKYYCVTLTNPTIFDQDGNNPTFISSYIFNERQQATQFFYDMKHSRTSQSVEIVSFRSKNRYTLHSDNWKTPIK